MLNVTAKVQKKTVPPNPGGAQVELRARPAGGVEPGVLTRRPTPKSDFFGVFAKFYRQRRAKLGIFAVFAKFFGGGQLEKVGSTDGRAIPSCRNRVILYCC